MEIFHLYTGIRGLLSPDKINMCCHPSLSYTGIRFHSITRPIFFSQLALVTMAIFLFAMGVSYQSPVKMRAMSEENAACKAEEVLDDGETVHLES